MTLPNERKSAVVRTAQFLLDLCDPKKTPRVPSAVRDQARRLIRHYPGEYDMERAGKDSPKIFGEWDD